MAGVILLGAFACIWTALRWETHNPWRFLAYLIAASIAGLMRIWLPGRGSCYSLASMYILLAMAVCGFGELIAIGFVAMAVESAILTGTRFDPLRVLFNASAMAISIALAYYPSYLMMNPGLRVLLPLALTISSGLIYLSYTFLMCGKSYLLGEEPFFKTWDSWLMNTFGYHLLGAAVAIILSVDPRIDD